jgi:hypothetical protein
VLASVRNELGLGVRCSALCFFWDLYLFPFFENLERYPANIITANLGYWQRNICHISAGTKPAET